MTASLTIAAIDVYQRRISPRKGWSCAYRVRRGGLSCSEWVKRAVAHHGVRTGALLARRRFQRCAAAARECREEGRWEDGPNEKRKKKPVRQYSCLPENLPAECCYGADLGVDVLSCIDLGGHSLGCADFAGCGCLPFL